MASDYSLAEELTARMHDEPQVSLGALATAVQARAMPCLGAEPDMAVWAGCLSEHTKSIGAHRWRQRQLHVLATQPTPADSR